MWSKSTSLTLGGLSKYLKFHYYRFILWVLNTLPSFIISKKMEMIPKGIMFYSTTGWYSAWKLRWLTERKTDADNWEQSTMAFYTADVPRQQECKKSRGQVKKMRGPSLWNSPFWTTTSPRDQVTFAVSLLCDCTARAPPFVYRLSF